MDPKPMEPWMAITVGTAAGLARQAHVWLTDGRKTTCKAILARGVVSAFSSWLAYLVAIRVSPDHVPLAVSISGWLGIEGIGLILSRFSVSGAPAVTPAQEKPKS